MNKLHVFITPFPGKKMRKKDWGSPSPGDLQGPIGPLFEQRAGAAGKAACAIVAQEPLGQDPAASDGGSR